jgi:hypothetical protein
MKTSYYNRYGDNINFEKIDDDTVEMTGYNYEWMRYGYPNVYDNAYSEYCKDNEKPISLIDFKSKVHEWKEGEKNPLALYENLVYSDTSTIDMVDPSGGPYMTVGMNLANYFETKDKMIIKSIEVKENSTIFKIEI